MDKEIKTISIEKMLADRWSPRSFSDKVPGDEILLNLLEAARWAPSSYNEQPWSYVLGIKGKGDSWDKVFECLNPFNQDWAKSAPVLMIVCAKKTFSHNDKDNGHFMYDSGASMSNLCVQATAEGLFVHQMGGFFPDKAKELLNIPEGVVAITAAAIGYLGDEMEPEDRKRKPLEEVGYLGQWGSSFS